jgi:hypothetical protein
MSADKAASPNCVQNRGAQKMNVPLTRRRLWEKCIVANSIIIVAAAARSAEAASLPLPTGKPILTITGRITVTNGPGVAEFDRPMLEALGTSGLETTTPWYNGAVRFEGVRMDRLMQEIGATGKTLIVYAINDYSVEVPVDDFSKFNVILALKRDGKYMSVRDKGPLFMVYPYDSMPELQHQRYYSRSVWQIARFEIR